MHRIALAGIVPALVATSALAQESPRITEADLLARLDDAHPAVVASGEALALAEAAARAAATLDNPIAGAVREDPSGAIRQTDLLLSWQLPDASRGPEVAARRRDADAAGARFAHRRLELRLALREAYADWSLAAARERLWQAQAARLARFAEREAARAEQGEASGLDRRRLELATLAARSQAELSRSATVSARARIAAWAPELAGDAEPALPDLPAAPPAASSHPAVIAAEADLAAAELDLQAASRFVASPELTLGWQRQESGPESIDGPIVGLAWSVPLFDRRQAERSAGEARRAAARARLDWTRREIEAERAAAAAAYHRLADVAAAHDGSGETDRRLLEGAEAAFALGEASLTDLLDTHRAFTEGELARLDLLTAALAAHRELERTAGAPLSSIATPTNPNQEP